MGEEAGEGAREISSGSTSKADQYTARMRPESALSASLALKWAVGGRDGPSQKDPTRLGERTTRLTDWMKRVVLDALVRVEVSGQNRQSRSTSDVGGAGTISLYSLRIKIDL